MFTGTWRFDGCWGDAPHALPGALPRKKRFTITERNAPAPVQAKRPVVRAPSLPVVVPPPAQPVPDVPKTGKRRWLWAAGAGIALGLGGLAYVQPWMAPIAQVGVDVVASGPVSRVLAVNGRVAGEVSVKVRPLVSGTRVEGDVIKVGIVLAHIDPATQAERLSRCYQTNANQSPFAQSPPMSGSAELTPLAESGGAADLEVVPAGEGALRVEQVVD